MKNIKTTMLAMLLCASLTMLSCSNDKPDTTDTQSGSDTAGQKVEQNLPTGDDTLGGGDTTETAPPVTLPPDTQTEEPTVETDPPLDDPTTDVPVTDDPVVIEPDDPADVTDPSGALTEYIGETKSGRFISEQSPNLVLCIDWESVILDDGTAKVTVDVGISHYRLFSREKHNLGAVQVDGVAELFSTPLIEYDENTKTYTAFFSGVYETDRTEMEIEASWQVLGTYGGIEIDTLTAGGTIVLGGES